MERGSPEKISMKRDRRQHHSMRDGGTKAHEYRPPIEGSEPREKGGRWFVKECCGIFTVFFVYFFVLWPCYFVGAVLSEPWPLGARIPVTCLMCIFAVGSLWSHAKCMATNPGTVPLRDRSVGYPMSDETLLSEAEGMRYCHKCDGPKPPRAHHCSTCGRCVMKMDHHCPWMNNCIGMYNLKYFMLFLMYVTLLSLTALSSIGALFATCKQPTGNALRGLGAIAGIDDANLVNSILSLELPEGLLNAKVDRVLRDGDAIKVNTTTKPTVWNRGPKGRKRTATQRLGAQQVCGLKPHNILLIVLLGLEAVVFGVFTTIMFVDALNMASSGDSQIDELGHSHGRADLPHQQKVQEMKANEKRTCRLGLQEFCGSPPSTKWLVPLRGNDTDYFLGLTDCDLYVLSTTFWDRYVIPVKKDIGGIEMGEGSPQTIGQPAAVLAT